VTQFVIDHLLSLGTILGYLLTLLLVPWVFLQRNKRPVSTLAWIMAILLLPYVGGLLFLVFGVNRVERRATRKLESNLTIGRALPELTQYQLVPEEAFEPQVQRLMRLADRVTDARPCHGNKVEILADTNMTQGLIEQAVQSATHSLHLEYYIWQPDRTGARLRDMLIERAKAGVQVRFLYDGIGSFGLTKKFLRPMLDAGIQVASFLPGRSWRERWSINLRSHRKIVIVDGQVGFTGGMNVGDEYLGRNPHLGYWRDTHLRLRGPVVLQLQQVFAEDWYFATREQLTHHDYFPHPVESGEQVAQVVASGPEGDFPAFHSLFFAAINEARERVTLATSYFVPTEALTMALQTAAQRGIQVRLLLSGRGAYPWMVLAGQSYYESLLASGVEIYEYQKGLMHSKTLTIDGIWSLVGSANLDSRSLLLNFEVGLVMYDPRMAAKLEDQFDADLHHATRIDIAVWQRRPFVQKLAENFLRLFEPIL
jgi:cardiolipin synthase